MEYKIISGRTVEVRRSMLDARPEYNAHQRRGVRVRGKTSLRKILANEREAVKNLARLLNCNFQAGDLWVTLTYSPERLPADREAAKADIQKFLRKVRGLYKKTTGESLRYVVTTSDKSPRDGEKARVHHHIVMDALAYEVIEKLWPKEDISYRRLDGRGDYTGVARYMVENAGRAEGKRRWSSSKGLRKPVYTEPVPVRAGERMRIPPKAVLREKNEFTDRETGMYSAYARYTVPRRPPRKATNGGDRGERDKGGRERK